MSLEERLLGLATDVRPDPLFRHRLRSAVLNRHVATREGLVAPVEDRRWIRREMGRLGRACLYASVALGVSAAGVLAVSQEAVPGEALYALKLRIEELRIEVLPPHLHDDLAIDVLGERVDEFRRLAASGTLAEALALVPAIERAYAEVEVRLATAGPVDAAMIEHRLAAIARLVDTLPRDLRNVLAALMPGLALGIEPPAAQPSPAPTPEPPVHVVPVAPATPPPPPITEPEPEPTPDESDGDDEDDSEDD